MFVQPKQREILINSIIYQINHEDQVLLDDSFGVILSPSFGSGHYSWNENCPKNIVTHFILVKCVMENNKITNDAWSEFVKLTKYEGSKPCSINDNSLRVKFVKINERFMITEYDGSESVYYLMEGEFIGFPNIYESFTLFQKEQNEELYKHPFLNLVRNHNMNLWKESINNKQLENNNEKNNHQHFTRIVKLRFPTCDEGIVEFKVHKHILEMYEYFKVWFTFNIKTQKFQKEDSSLKNKFNNNQFQRESKKRKIEDSNKDNEDNESDKDDEDEENRDEIECFEVILPEQQWMSVPKTCFLVEEFLHFLYVGHFRTLHLNQSSIDRLYGLKYFSDVFGIIEMEKSVDKYLEWFHKYKLIKEIDNKIDENNKIE